MSETNRNQSMIVQVNLDVMTPEQIETLLQDIIDSNGLNCDCITKDIYVFDEKKKDEILVIMKNGGAVCRHGFPKRWTVASNVEQPDHISRDGVKSVRLTVENLNASDVILNSLDTAPIDQEWLNKMILKDLKLWVQGREDLDKNIDLRLKKENIINAILKFYN